jgi:hypothetical protein
MRFILTATRKADNSRLHLLNRHTEYYPWTVCWNYSPANGDWDWGSYNDTLKDALGVFSRKVGEHGFDDVVDGYTDRYGGNAIHG